MSGGKSRSVADVAQVSVLDIGWRGAKAKEGKGNGREGEKEERGCGG